MYTEEPFPTNGSILLNQAPLWRKPFPQAKDESARHSWPLSVMSCYWRALSAVRRALWGATHNPASAFTEANMPLITQWLILKRHLLIGMCHQEHKQQYILLWLFTCLLNPSLHPDSNSFLCTSFSSVLFPASPVLTVISASHQGSTTPYLHFLSPLALQEPISPPLWGY